MTLLTNSASVDQEKALLLQSRQGRIVSFIAGLPAKADAALNSFTPLEFIGKVQRLVGTTVYTTLSDLSIGEIVELHNTGQGLIAMAECVGFLDKSALLSPIGDIQGVSSQTDVYRTGKAQEVGVGHGLLGRVVDGLGNFIDEKTNGFSPEAFYPVFKEPPAPLSRTVIKTLLPTGIRAIDGLLSCGEGQRIGVFAAAGVGKSTLLSMIAKGTIADIVVLALIGERGREVREFIESGLGQERLENCVIVASTSDQSPMERVKAANIATAIAEFYRDEGKKVLFLMDSVTRYARALREIGLAAGEPPTRRGFPPSVFTNLPKLLERTGTNEKGSITAFYTVLVEGDDLNEPIADETRSILDGHIILSRELAAENYYPAIDILGSVSRLMPAITTAHHQDMAARIRQWLDSYNSVEILLRVGEYKKGNDPETDLAIAKKKAINAYLQQRVDEFDSFDTVLEKLERLTQ